MQTDPHSMASSGRSTRCRQFRAAWGSRASHRIVPRSPLEWDEEKWLVSRDNDGKIYNKLATISQYYLFCGEKAAESRNGMRQQSEKQQRTKRDPLGEVIRKTFYNIFCAVAQALSPEAAFTAAYHRICILLFVSFRPRFSYFFCAFNIPWSAAGSVGEPGIILKIFLVSLSTRYRYTVFFFFITLGKSFSSLYCMYVSCRMIQDVNEEEAELWTKVHDGTQEGCWESLEWIKKYISWN